MFFLKKRTSTFVVLSVLLLTLFFYPYGKPEPIRYVNRHTGTVEREKTPAAFWLNWLYVNPLGELSLEALIKRKAVSTWYGRLMDKPSSANKIGEFVRDYGIDLSIVQDTHFTSFNDFFIRKLKPEVRPVDTAQNVVVSPVDGKVLVFENVSNQDFIVKGERFNLKKFVMDDSVASIFKEGSMLLFRLCPADYHRFHFPCSGTVLKSKKVDGAYYSVSPLAIKRNIEIFCSNKRVWTLIKTERFGTVLMSEVGATMVGTIIQTYKGDSVVKGAEKGYFKFGGSSVVLLFEKGQIKIDNDLLRFSNEHMEATVLYGEHVAIASGIVDE